MVQAPSSFLQAETDNVYQNTDHFQLWERRPRKEEKIQLIIWPSPEVMIESFINTSVVKDGQGHRICLKIQWLGAACWLSKYIYNFFQLTIVKNDEVFKTVFLHLSMQGPKSSVYSLFQWI